MKLFHYKLFLSFFCACLFSCSKPDTKPQTPEENLPARTDTGANILVCKVNGKTQVYSGKTTLFNGDGVSYVKWNIPVNAVVLGAYRPSKRYGSVRIQINTWDAIVGQEYNFKLDDAISIEGRYEPDNNLDVYYTQTNSGKINFTRFDDSVMAGSFHFTATQTDTNLSVEISDGYFDIKRNTN